MGHACGEPDETDLTAIGVELNGCQVYMVGDNVDACGSLACIGGKPGECVAKPLSGADAKFRGFQATCAPPAGATRHVGNNLGFEEVAFDFKNPAMRTPKGWVSGGKVLVIPQDSKDWGTLNSGSGKRFSGVRGGGGYIEQRLYGLSAGEVYKLKFLAPVNRAAH